MGCPELLSMLYDPSCEQDLETMRGEGEILLRVGTVLLNSLE